MKKSKQGVMPTKGIRAFSSICSTSFLAILTALLLWGNTLSAQIIPLSEFEKASNSEGVNLIPFPDVRKEATAIANEVNYQKNEIKKWGYSTWQTKKDALLKKKAAKEKEIAAKEKEKADYKKAYPTVTVSQFDKDLKTMNDALDDIEDDIKALNKQLEGGVEVWTRMYNARGGLREQFIDALKLVDRAQSNPKTYLGSSASADDISKVKTYLSKIESKIKSEERTHKDQEDGAKGNVTKFEELIKKSSL